MTLQPIAFFGGSTGGGEMLLILVVALLLFGSKNLPRVARNVGRAMEEMRKTVRTVRDEIMQADEDAPAEPAKPAALPPVARPKEGPDEPVARG